MAFFRKLFLICCGLLIVTSRTALGYQLPMKQWTNELKTGYERRVAADPSFASKSITEVLLAAGTQLTAEWNRRGTARMLPEIDFVVPAILTAVFGKYYRYVDIFRSNLVLKPALEPRVYVKFLSIADLPPPFKADSSGKVKTMRVLL